MDEGSAATPIPRDVFPQRSRGHSAHEDVRRDVAQVAQHAYGLQALGYLLGADADAIVQAAIQSDIGD